MAAARVLEDVVLVMVSVLDEETVLVVDEVAVLDVVVLDVAVEDVVVLDVTVELILLVVVVVL